MSWLTVKWKVWMKGLLLKQLTMFLKDSMTKIKTVVKVKLLVARKFWAKRMKIVVI